MNRLGSWFWNVPCFGMRIFVALLLFLLLCSVIRYRMMCIEKECPKNLLRHSLPARPAKPGDTNTLGGTPVPPNLPKGVL